MLGMLPVLSAIFATSFSHQISPVQNDEWTPFIISGNKQSSKPVTLPPLAIPYQNAEIIYNPIQDSSEYDDLYIPGEPNTKKIKPIPDGIEASVDEIADKNYKPPPVATAETGGLPFIVYALKNITWLFGVGTVFLMFVGTVCAYAYRWTRAHQNTSFGRITDLSTVELIYKALELWNDLESEGLNQKNDSTKIN